MVNIWSNNIIVHYHATLNLIYILPLSRYLCLFFGILNSVELSGSECVGAWAFVYLQISWRTVAFINSNGGWMLVWSSMKCYTNPIKTNAKHSTVSTLVLAETKFSLALPLVMAFAISNAVQGHLNIFYIFCFLCIFSSETLRGSRSLFILLSFAISQIYASKNEFSFNDAVSK